MGVVERMKEYIAAGDAFQVVPSQRFSAPFALPPFALYRALRRVNPAPFLFFLDFGGFAVVGSSPEILVRLRDGTVTLRPLAGTRPRGATREEDLALERELSTDPKERAEHLMLLDLGRNDVGRVAELGTRAGDRELRRRAVQPRDAPLLHRRGPAAAGTGRAGRADRRLSRRHAHRGAEDPRHGDHRGAGADPARHLRRLHRLFRRQRHHGHLHRPAHRGGQGRHHVRPGRRRRGRRQHAGGRVGRKRAEKPRPVPRRRGSRAVCGAKAYG